MTVSYTLVVPTAYGPMMINRNDINQTGALVKFGMAPDHGDIELLRALLRVMPEGRVFIDVGGNFGAYSLGLAPLVSKVMAFEPQRVIYNMLCGSVALNALEHVYVYNMAVGAGPGEVEIPQFDYSKPLNFGSVEFGPEQREKLSQERKHDETRSEKVPLVSLDSFNLPRVDIIKIDAEGMEDQVLAGLDQTLRRCRPILYIEFIKSDRAALQATLADYGYDVHVNNINYLCIPSEARDKYPLRRGANAATPAAPIPAPLAAQAEPEKAAKEKAAKAKPAKEKAAKA